MDTYIRFQTHLRCGNTGRPAGIFVAAVRIEERATTPEITRNRLSNVLIWFNQNLMVPSLDASHWRSLFWFRPNSQSVISQLWERVHLLEDEGVFVTKVRTSQPRKIVYQDEHQVAAVPRKKKHALRV